MSGRLNRVERSPTFEGQKYTSVPKKSEPVVVRFKTRVLILRVLARIMLQRRPKCKDKHETWT